MPPLISKEEMDTMDSGDESEDGPMSMDLSEDIGKESCYLHKTWLKVYAQVFYNIRHDVAN